MNRRDILKAMGVAPFMPLLGNDLVKSRFSGNVHSKPATKGYHLVVYGATPGGVALALRAAREGLKVLLVNHTQHLGGMRSEVGRVGKEGVSTCKSRGW